jgi:murein DD-endopeptidase MepM/ murein hydrolase activator NlpD
MRNLHVCFCHVPALTEGIDLPPQNGPDFAGPHPALGLARTFGAVAVVVAVVAGSFWLNDDDGAQPRPRAPLVLASMSLDPEPIKLPDFSPVETALNVSIDPGDYRLSELGAEPSEMAEEADDAEGALQIVKVRNGDTFLDLLMGVGISRAQAHDAVSALRTVFNPRDLKVGQEVTLTVAAPPGKGESAALLAANFAARPDLDIALSRDSDGRFTALPRERALKRELVRATGAIRSSLFDAGSAAGVPGAVMVEFIRAFSFDVDFQRDLQQGDVFEIVFERFRDSQGRFAKDGVILYGAMLLSGETKKIYRYTPGDGGPPDYYNEKGESVRKALLRTPIDGARLTSGFGSRNHPILGYSAMHKGVDFGAPAGTPIQAAGDGVIEQSGWNGSYGNYIRIRHNSDFASAYAHMSRIAPNLRAGARVRQGQIIGYVGTTGRSTGPHLHYEIMRRGAQVNPMSIQAPIGRKLEGPMMTRFREARADIDLQVTALAPTTRVAVSATTTQSFSPQSSETLSPVRPRPAATR